MGSYNKSTGFYSQSIFCSDSLFKDKFSGVRSVQKATVLEILRLDYQIRLLDQREESLKHKDRAWKKTKDLGDVMEQLSAVDFDAEIRSARAERLKNETPCLG